MSSFHDLALLNGSIVLPDKTVQTTLYLRDGLISAIGENAPTAHRAAQTLDCTGLTILPGVIDTQVHFREPGAENNETLESGSRAAVLGGVTGVFEMPNTTPPTTTLEALTDKLNRAHNRMWCDHAFYIGATAYNAEQCGQLETLKGAAGIKIFMGSSTGDLLVSDDLTLERVLRSGHRRIAVHAEDENRLQERRSYRVENDPASHPVWRDDQTALQATQRLLALARKIRRRVHILHVSTPEELALIAQYRDIATCEITPQHLTLNAEDAYVRLGTFAQMNPPIRSAAHRAALWQWIDQGLPDVIGSDHAPHSREAKAKPYPQSPSGMPGVQTLVPLMLNHVAHHRLSLRRFVDLTSSGPQRVFGLVRKGRISIGYDADLTIVDLKAQWTIDPQWLASRCGWSPFVGERLIGKPIGTFIRGHRVMWEGTLADHPIGQPFRFEATEKP
ncbi:MAG: dihydroorotase [Acetobacter sp.]|nr:dihydroorotase [Acetobacter sp.]